MNRGCCFVKQKTAYEMRISDWSSDVCSSDLSRSLALAQSPHLVRRHSTSSASPAHSWRIRYSTSRAYRPPPKFSPRSAMALASPKIGRASCRERVCQYVSISVGGVSLKKKQHNLTPPHARTTDKTK